MTIGILYYTDGWLDKGIFGWIGPLVRSYIEASGLPIVSISLKPLDFGDKSIHFKLRRSHQTMFRQILTGLKACDFDNVFMCEHDVLYHPSHFDFTPPTDDLYYYNDNVWKYRLADGKAVTYTSAWLSQCCSNRDILIEHYEKKLSIIEEGGKAFGYEPGSGQSRKIDKYGHDLWRSEYPCIDLRHGKNWTGTGRMSQDEFRNKKYCKNWREGGLEDIPGWDTDYLKGLFDEYRDKRHGQ
jgi:hypothetical protein